MLIPFKVKASIYDFGCWDLILPVPFSGQQSLVSLSETQHCWWARTLAHQLALLNSPSPWEMTFNMLNKERVKNFESLLADYLRKTFSLDCYTVTIIIFLGASQGPYFFAI